MKINTGYVKVGRKAKMLMQDILTTSRISCGKYVSQFEKEYAKKHNVKHAITVGSGTEADILALLALVAQGKVFPGSEVIMPATCFISVANAILFAGMKPVFVDTTLFNMSIEKLKSTICSETKAIIGVHFGGLPLDMEYLKEVAGDIPIIEDCACAHGTITNDKITGSQGLLSTWSLYVAHIVTAGGGGVIATNDDGLAEILYSIRAYGRSCTCRPCLANISGDTCSKRFNIKNKDMRFLYKRMGLNSRMTEMEAAIGLDQMDIYDDIVSIRQNNFANLKKMLAIKKVKYTTFPNQPSGFKLSPIFFPIIVNENVNRDMVVIYLESKGIETRNLYACIPTQQPAYKWHPQSKERFPNAERLGNKGFYVGIHQGLEHTDLEYMAEHIAMGIKKAEI